MVLKSSEDTQTSKNILTKDYISKAIKTLSDYSYDELYVLVDFVEESEECSFGSDLIDDIDPELIGDIEIGTLLKLEEQYYALIHEIGHAVLYTTREEPEDVVLLETLAWCEGIRIANKLGLKVNENKFRKQMIYAINLYNDRSNNDS
jgi:Zn-dependent peptidase ImmA (M78 family)